MEAVSCISAPSIVAALLGKIVSPGGQVWTLDVDQAQHAAVSLLADPEPSIAVFQTGFRGLAREVLNHPTIRALFSAERTSALGSVVADAGLGAGTLSADHQRSLTEAVTLGEAELRRLLRDDQTAPGNPPIEVPQPT
ncbi:hypothetical protein ACFW32_01085 [Streptomyces mutabilis]|uniref:hypothetical protein n=1 Tax=Streptomyces mutabilis TaxID=67332 RepID=UPI0036849E0C